MSIVYSEDRRVELGLRLPRRRPVRRPEAMPAYVVAPREWNLSAPLARLYEAYGGRCYYCGEETTCAGAPERAPTRDHRIPLSRGGLNHVANKVLACFGCNQAKGTMTDAEYWTAIGRPANEPA